MSRGGAQDYRVWVALSELGATERHDAVEGLVGMVLDTVGPCCC